MGSESVSEDSRGESKKAESQLIAILPSRGNRNLADGGRPYVDQQWSIQEEGAKGEGDLLLGM